MNSMWSQKSQKEKELSALRATSARLNDVIIERTKTIFSKEAMFGWGLEKLRQERALLEADAKELKKVRRKILRIEEK